ncbi:hypothetical protein V6N13_015438 [Hibiscus sabdariffa]|uniref:Uncharacterized protein n=1 Tax=Hibiscus sabdariffa TaxID=183260 RepID=A0ABR2CW27_9ROSI
MENPPFTTPEWCHPRVMDLHHLDSIIGDAHGLYPSFGTHLFVKSVEYLQIHQPYPSGDFVYKLLSYKTPMSNNSITTLTVSAAFCNMLVSNKFSKAFSDCGICNNE